MQQDGMQGGIPSVLPRGSFPSGEALGQVSYSDPPAQTLLPFGSSQSLHLQRDKTRDSNPYRKHPAAARSVLREFWALNSKPCVGNVFFLRQRIVLPDLITWAGVLHQPANWPRCPGLWHQQTLHTWWCPCSKKTHSALRNHFWGHSVSSQYQEIRDGAVRIIKCFWN